jgi:hypothetical protein
MIDLITECAASKITGLPVTLTHVRTLQSFDGPLLAEFRGEGGEPYLYYWCDRAGEIDRWMVLRTLPQDLARYELRLMSLREVITKSPERYMFLVDLDRDDREQTSYLVKAESLPEQYLPTKESFSDTAAESESGKQELFVGENWGPEQVTESPRRYQNVYDFLALLGRHGSARRLPRITYNLTQGYVFYRLFEKFHEWVVPEKEGNLRGLAFASPGYIRFDVEPTIAADVRRAAQRLAVARETIRASERALREWASGKEKKGMSQNAALEILADVCRSLDINYRHLMEHVDMPHTAIKVVRSYISKLDYLIDDHQEHAVMVVGLNLPEKPKPKPKEEKKSA